MASPYMPTLPTLGAQPTDRYAMLAQHYQKVYGGQPGTQNGPGSLQQGKQSWTQPYLPPGTTGQGATGPTWKGGQPFFPGQRGTEQNPQPMGYYRGRHWINTGPDAGRVLYGSNGDFLGQFPGAKEPGFGFVDYSSRSWQLALALNYGADPNDPMARAWNAIPDPWKADLAGWDPSYRNAWLQAEGSGDFARAAKIKADYARNKSAATNEANYLANQPQLKAPTQPNPYFPQQP